MTAALTRWRAALPFVAVGVFTLVVGFTVVAAVAAGMLGFDFLAYHQAANRVLAGQPLYDPTVQQAGGFGLFYYPPPFVFAVLPLAPLPPGIASLVWLALSIAAFAVGVALMPVSREIRWITVLLAGMSWPFAYAIKLGQVGPLLFLLFAVGWRWIDRPAALGASAAIGALVKIQPGILIVWAALTQRWRAVGVSVAVVAIAALIATLVVGPGTWNDYMLLLRNVSDPITTPHNFTPGAVAFQMGASSTTAAIVQLAVSIAVVLAVLFAARAATSDASYLVAVVASQLLSPVLWDHYAMLLLLPTAWLLQRGVRWAVAIPLATSTLLIAVAPAAAYPLSFVITLAGLLVVGTAPATRRRDVVAAPKPA